MINDQHGAASSLKQKSKSNLERKDSNLEHKTLKVQYRLK